MKLKKLVLNGFKSFADRTEFDFDAGVTCVVGPNGCGKSNVVDAFKWVLGSQSAKSLRGSEMADVIFNGSAGRRPAGMAEVTLVFDNSSGLLQPAVKAAEGKAADGTLSVTRRLYRSGLSEYCINNVPCRLRDIRELFMDTGVGVDAYSLIEQGKVEVFLQASQDERRAIFDEAAGISKYKARRKEALRKLERVEQNLLRINDIVQEVEKRLRSIKYQAGKARNYQAYSERLKELRSLHFLARYHGLTGRRAELSGRLDAAGDVLSGIAARIGQLEAARSAAEVEAVDLERSARELQGRIASVGGQITTCEERAEMLARRVEELDEQVLAGLRRAEELEAKIEAAAAERTQRESGLAELEQQLGQFEQQHKAARERHAAGELALAQLRAQLEDEKAGTIDLLRRTAHLHNEISGLGIRREGLDGQKQRLSDRAEQIEQTLRDLLTERAAVEEKREEIRAVLEESTRRLEQARQASERAHASEQSLRAELSEARERRSALASRIDALREMQQRLEGVAGGVRRLVEAHRAGRLPELRGLLGDFLEADTDHAAAVEAALAGADQLLLAGRFEELTAAAGRVREALGEGAAAEVVCLDRLEDAAGETAPPPADLERVLDHVRCPAELGGLLRRLLGRTLLVETLEQARALAGAPGGPWRFVTRSGEVVEPDGRVRFGAANRGGGIVARRSELAELSARRDELDGRIAGLEDRCISAHSEVEHLDELQQKLRTAIYEANTERVEYDGRLARLDEQVDALRREQPVVAGDIESISAEIEQTVRAEHEARRQAEQLDQLSRRRQEQVERLEGEIAQAAAAQQQLNAEMTDVKVALAAVDAKRRAAREALSAVERQLEAMRQDLQAERRQVELGRQRKADAQQAIADARAEVDRLFATQQQLTKEAADVEESRKGLEERLEQVRAELAEKRKEHEAAVEQVNAVKVELGEVDVRIEDLLARASEEMSMNLVELSKDYQHDEQRDWDAVEAEIQDLRGKIERLGNVNLDAISEQEELEQRREFLGGQLADIEASRRQLNDLIRRLNRESRELFLQMFQKVRENFQALFRKLFGGGRADIVLVDPDNVLETGVEIIARPPGKELRSLSLLSGGEKTMAALSLMFSIFKCRPSPFCLLDEVDAALDEQNTERFARLVQEFVADSQFLIISHAKRTMSLADVLYGVTMQEPGVSRRISVRFEEAVRHAGTYTPETEPVAAT